MPGAEGEGMERRLQRRGGEDKNGRDGNGEKKQDVEAKKGGCRKKGAKDKNERDGKREDEGGEASKE